VREHDVVYCPRPTGAHALAWVEAQPNGERTVVAITAVATRRGMTHRQSRFTEVDLDETTSLSTMVTCGCGFLFDLGLVAVLRGRPVTLRPVPPEEHTGVSYYRARRRGS
jgi:hypothetical protein